MRDSLAGNSNSKTLKTENSKLTQENRKLTQEINELKSLNRKMESRWETTEKDLKGVKKELKLIIDEKDNNYNKLEEEYIRVQAQLETHFKKSTSNNINSPKASNLYSKGSNVSNRRTKIENLFTDESLLSGVEEQYPIWAATLKRSDERANKSKEELRTFENGSAKQEGKITLLGSHSLDKTKHLQRRIDELEEEKSKLSLENTKYDLSIKQKEKEKNLLIDKLIACETKLESFEEEIRILQANLKDNETTQKYNENSISRLKSKVNDLETENLRLTGQRNELQIQADRAQREARLAKGELEYELKHAGRSNSHVQEEHRVKNVVTALNTKIEELESQLKESKAKIGELENYKIPVQNLTVTKKDLEELEKLNDQIRQERDHLKLRLEKSITLTEGYEKRIHELETQLTKCYKEIKDFHNKNEELRLNENELEDVKKQLQAAQLQNEAIEARALIVEDENKRLRENVGEEIGDEERMISNLKIMEFERSEMLQNYKKVCFENEKIKTELAEILIAHKECLRELRDTKTEADAWRARTNEPEKGDDEYFNQVAIFEELNQKLITAESLAEEYRQSKEKVEEELIDAREEKQRLESSGTENQQTLNNLQRENGTLKEDLIKIKTDLEILRQELDKKAINNEVLKGLLEDEQKKNQWKPNSIQLDRRLESEESFLSSSLRQESKRKGISSDKIMQFYSPQGKSDGLKWDQGYKDQSKGLSKFDRKSGYESKLVFGGQEDKNYWSQELGGGIKQETRSLWDSNYLKTEGDDPKKKKYGSVSLAYDKKFSKF